MSLTVDRLEQHFQQMIACAAGVTRAMTGEDAGSAYER